MRVSEHVYQAQHRLKRIIQLVPEDFFNILIVDYGTAKEFLFELKDIASPNLTTIRVDCESSPFSIGHARDIGVQHAVDSVVMFHDVDFICSTEMYRRIHAEVEMRNLAINAYDFFCIPVFFMSESGSSVALDLLNQSHGDLRLHQMLYSGLPGMVEFAAFGSSAIVANKWHYLSLGGHSRAFFGHGAEDYDLLHRLASLNPKGPRTKDYKIDTKTNSIQEYRGFRSYFALYGVDVFARCIFQVHLWHPKRTIPGYNQSNRNFTLLTELMEGFDKKREQPLPLSNVTQGSRALFLMKPDTSSFQAIRQVVSLFGSYSTLDEKNFAEPQDLVDYCERKAIDYVILLNPYGNAHRLALYRSLRNASIKYFVFDRGALPDSWFFDPNGFNYDSNTYAVEKWNRELNEDEWQLVEDYKNQLKNGESALENMGGRKTARFYREMLGVSDRKVVFVPFQRPSDTVTNYFAGPAESVYSFQKWIEALASKLPKSDWVIICKNHPLDLDLPPINGVVYAPQDAHINDLIDLADTVLLMNSGVGVISLAFDKRVICASNAFYCHPGLASRVNSVEEIIELMNDKDVLPNRKAVNAFLFYLIDSVYSFGDSVYKNTIAADGAPRRIVTDIRFDRLNIPGISSLKYGQVTKGLSLDAPIFWSFGGRAGIKSTLAPSAVPKKVSEVKSAVKPTQKVVNPHSDQVQKLTARQRKLRKLATHPILFVKDYLAKKIK